MGFFVPEAGRYASIAVCSSPRITGIVDSITVVRPVFATGHSGRIPALSIAPSGSEHATLLSAASVTAASVRRLRCRSAAKNNATLTSSKYGLSSMATTVATIATPFGGGTTIQMQSIAEAAASVRSSAPMPLWCRTRYAESYEDRRVRHSVYKRLALTRRPVRVVIGQIHEERR